MSNELYKKIDFSRKPQRIVGLNVVGLCTLIEREVNRFTTVYTQTIIAPVVTTLLFYAVFALAFGGYARTVNEVPFLEFLAPGLIMMTMVQNAFANTSSSLIISKVQGSIVDVIMPPLSSFELFIGFITGGVARGLAVGVVTTITVSFFVNMGLHSLLLILLYAVLGNLMLSSIGLAAGIYAEKFDHVAAITNFIVTPLTFLSGTFYSISNLPEMWRAIAYYNPFFYMIDGFRSGFIGYAETDPWLGILVLSLVNAALAVLIVMMFRTGYKIKS